MRWAGRLVKISGKKMETKFCLGSLKGRNYPELIRVMNARIISYIYIYIYIYKIFTISPYIYIQGVPGGM